MAFSFKGVCFSSVQTLYDFSEAAYCADFLKIYSAAFLCSSCENEGRIKTQQLLVKQPFLARYIALIIAPHLRPFSEVKVNQMTSAGHHQSDTGTRQNEIAFFLL